LIAAGLIFGNNLLCFNVINANIQIGSILQPILGMLSIIIIAVVIGLLSDLMLKLKIEIATRKQVEAELKNYKDHLEHLVQERTAELEKTQEHLHHAEKMEALGQLTGGIVHDFKNMLGGIVGLLDLFKAHYTGSDPKLNKYIEMIFETSARAAELISSLLLFARKGETQFESLKVHNLISNTIKLLDHSLDKSITINHFFNAESSVINGDYTQIQNVLLNFAVNARDAMPDGGTLTFSTDTVIIDDAYKSLHPDGLESGLYTVISVSDTGAGIDKETKKKIFEPFFTTKEKGQGTGMGLSSAYGIIENHKGSIEVYSEPGEGATFKVYLPHIDKKDNGVRNVESIVTMGSGAVLLIDDDEIIRKVGTEMLSNLGYSVVSCENGREGIDYYKSHFSQIDFIILDVMMPNLKGYNCFHELKKIDSNATIVVASGYPINGLISDILDEGAASFIQKPFDTVRLSKAIEKAKSSHKTAV